MARTLINVPKTAKAGEVVEIKVLIAHPMETGFRPGPNGQILPRDIVTRFACRYDGEEVFAADLSPALAANPFLTFTTVATRTGTLTFTWEGDNGFSQTETANLVVEA
ncbi:MAG TPA: thiosulfate oxidation carrier complex protein SoxZ [Microvirga sp.]|jgi:sulfur-oxidizing protein SoxZ|nr:thiosulfate oxidation carrier complex protein SoxZ [Microvirga sp.]